MKVLYASGFAVVACAVAVGVFLGLREVPPLNAGAVTAALPVQSGLIAHEWGTFTSFSGSDGVHVGFRPNNEDLPSFVYHLRDNFSKVAFTPLGVVPGKGEVVATMPREFVESTKLGELLVTELKSAGLYEKEALAMVETWRQAWFGEDGYRVLYTVPRPLTDELLPLTVDPKPTEVVRVLVGRHDFVTPEQEAMVEKQVRRARAAQEELNAAERELGKVGRFGQEARTRAAFKIDSTDR